MAGTPTTKTTGDERAVSGLQGLLRRMNVGDIHNDDWGQGPPVSAAEIRELLAYLKTAPDGPFIDAFNAVWAMEHLARHNRLDAAAKLKIVRSLVDIVEKPGRYHPLSGIDGHAVRQGAASALGMMGRDARIALPALFAYKSENRTPSDFQAARNAICSIVEADSGIREAITRLVAEDKASHRPKRSARKSK